MKTKTEEKEVKEFELLTEDQIELIPEPARENVVFLTEHVNPKDLAELNPLVTKLLEIRKMASDVKFEPQEGEGKKAFDMDNIQKFIDTQGEIKSYRAAVRSTAKDLKANYIKINKGYKAVEDTFINEATVVFDALEKEFKPYRDYQQQVKDEREKKKNEAILQASKEAEEKASEAQAQMQKTNTYNKIKYDVINAKVTEAASDLILTANKATLLNFQKELSEQTYDVMTDGIDDSMLDKEVKAELIDNFNHSKKKAQALIENRLEAIETETRNTILEHPMPKESATITPPPSPNTVEKFEEAEKQIDKVIPPLAPAPPIPMEERIERLDKMTDEEFVENIRKTISECYSYVVDRIQKKPMSSPSVYDLRNELDEIIN